MNKILGKLIKSAQETREVPMESAVSVSTSTSTPVAGMPIQQHPYMTGAVRKLKDGYGFIAGDDGNDYFFHWSAMIVGSKNFRDLIVQERVDFSCIKTSEGKLRAISVRVI